MQYRVVEAKGERGPRKITTAGYNYSIQDGTGKEILAYHWHPWVRPVYPHMHVCPAADVNMLRKIHLPSGRIAIEDVLRLLIEQFKVNPIKANWDRILKQTKNNFEKFRSWG